ncbi:MAG: 5'/3'-nucleotidase SurE [Anaerolineales bacterium]|jgi:5'-nucleotidase|nr:5'/3'-nucleotidase SurE [Anaerolineales bacterium]MBX3005306.1 5'/3'-nucleotidase SurE [Anaerolineales bacterium]MCW5838493.1 5'/3'-nucleotidase SurE [Anaerolineales bacterium]MCW5888362.1 5'/3'-nucleotidase SurE [Anaerolineales bacterium]
MKILVTNDDGITHPGLLALVQAVKPLGDVTVLAPDRNWSASGHVKTLHRPLRVRPTELPDGTPAHMSDGAPSDCIALALLGYFDHAFDLVVSGINPYANIGDDVTYSGTVTAAMEAAIGGLPGIAFSLDSPIGLNGQRDFSAASAICRRVATRVAAAGLPRQTLLNVNIPYLPLEEIKGVQVTRLGMRVYRDELVRRIDPQHNPYYWIGGEAPTGQPDEGTEVAALQAGYVSVTPLHMDMTSFNLIPELAGWSW